MASKSKSRRRVFRASCILAALIVAGSSFAWFTSSDEVTNKLSATADYGVAIAEDFTPPEKWLPGQKIEKNVGIVNTGNIDAFVRTWLEGEMDLLAQKRDKTTWTDADGAFTDNTTTSKVAINNTAKYTKDTGTDRDKDTITGTDITITKTKDDKLNALGMTYSYEDGNATAGANKKVYLKELDTTIYANPNTPTADKNNPAYFSEVMSVQAGGSLAYLKTGATTGTGAGESANLFYYTPNNSNEFKSDKDNAFQVDGTKNYLVKLAGDTTRTVDTKVNDIVVGKESGQDVIYVKDEATAVKYLGEHIDSDNFYPAATGLFIFKRNADKDATTNDPTVSDYEFSGYYYVKSGTETGKLAADDDIDIAASDVDKFDVYEKQGKYFALQYDKSDKQRSDYVLEKDTYTVTLDKDGNVAFYPYVDATATYDTSKTAHKIGGKWYGEDGKELATAPGSPDANSEKSVTLFTAQEDVIENDELVWKYYQNTYINNGKAYYWDATDGGGKWKTVGDETEVSNEMTTTLNNATDTHTKNMNPMYVVSDDFGSGLKVDIQLADTILDAGQYTGLTEVAAAAATGKTANAETWTRVVDTESTPADNSDPSNPVAATPKHDTFYYNNDVEEGATTSRLVDSVLLDGSVTQYDFLAFDFDLNVFMDSLQVTPDSAGIETTTNVKAWAAADSDNGNVNNDGKPVAATGTRNGDPNPTTTEIEFVNWATT